jgi:urease accessory protein
MGEIADLFARRTGVGAAGRGHLGFARVDGATALVRCSTRSPLRVLVPRHRDRSAWAFLATYGGGLVAGDRIDVTIEVGPGAVAMVATQAETKVYRSPSGSACTQVIRAHVARGGALVLIPDPISPFAGARYVQEQQFEVDEGASLLYLDALVAGRTARGERWAFDDYRSRTELRVRGTLLLGDALVLGRRAGPSLADRLGRYQALAVAALVGPAFTGGASALLDKLGNARAEVLAPVVATVSSLPGGVLLRAAATSAEHLTRFVRESLSFVAELLGGDPFRHRW